MDKKHPYSSRSFFWPIVLIGIGVIMLLANLDLLPSPSVRLLLRLWPLALVVLGLDLLVGRRSPIIGGLIGLGAIALVVALLYMAPSLELEPAIERKTLAFNEPLGSADAAIVSLDLERYATTVQASIDSEDLFDALLETYTDASFRATGSGQKSISLKPAEANLFNFDWTMASTRDMTWEIGLSPAIPLNLSVDVGSGSANLDLFGLTLSALKVDGGSGHTELAIPASSSLYPVDIDGGSGSFDIEIEAGADLEGNFSVGSGSFDIIFGSGVAMMLEIDGGSGSIVINVPGDVGVRLVVDDGGSGGVRVPVDFNLVDDRDDDDGDTGIWESDHYADAESIVEIRFDPGSGSLTLR
jgi:hypothetical protein